MDRPKARTRRASRRRCRSSILKSLENSSRITTESPSALRSCARASDDASALRRRQGTSFLLDPADDRHDEEHEGTEHLVCGASFLNEDGTQHTRTLLPRHPSGHTGIPGPSVVEG